MDTTTRAGSRRPGSTGTPQPLGGADQPPLPFAPLPYDDESDRPIGYALTARARRRVDPGAVPSLAIVPSLPGPTDACVDDPHDTRPARARALRRAGLAIHEISAQLEVDELLIEAWTTGVRRARSRTDRGSTTPRSGSSAATRPTVATTLTDTVAGRPTVPDPLVEERRDASRRRARGALAGDPSFALGLGLLMGVADVDRHAITIRTTRQDVAVRTLEWLRGQVEFDGRRVRVVLRVGSAVAADLARHRWASVLGVEPAAMGVSRWRDAPNEDAVEALVRIGDPLVAAAVDGFRAALDEQGLDVPPADVAF